jgi:hypothetical protein
LLDGQHHYKDSQAESLVYHLLQSANVYVGNLFFKGYPLVASGRSPTTFSLINGSLDRIGRGNQGKAHDEMTHWRSFVMDHD